MREPSAAEARGLLAVQAIQQAYGDAVNRRAWADLGDLFWDDAVVRIDTRTRPTIELRAPDELVSFIDRSLEPFAFFELTILDAVASVEGAEARGRMYICEQRCTPDGSWTTAYGLYQDEYRRRGVDWRISGRRYHSLARTGPPIEVFPLPPIV